MMADSKVKFDLGDGQALFIETDMPDDDLASEFIFASSEEGGGNFVKSQKQFTEVAQSIAPVANTILESLKDINSPKEIQLEFGVKLDVASNVLIAKASTAANFKIMLKWENNNADLTKK